ncbi:MAG: hypothetical protein ABF649_03610 [Bacillus sp. (in: firmicutes)]
MMKILYEDRRVYEQAIYLPLVLAVLEYDRKATENSSFKMKQVYLNLIEHTVIKVQKDLKLIQNKMRVKQMKLLKGANDGICTPYTFYYHDWHETHRYDNANLKSTTEKVLLFYFMKES